MFKFVFKNKNTGELFSLAAKGATTKEAGANARREMYDIFGYQWINKYSWFDYEPIK